MSRRAGDRAPENGKRKGGHGTMKWRPRAFSRVSTVDSDILSSCDMNDEHA